MYIYVCVCRCLLSTLICYRYDVFSLLSTILCPLYTSVFLSVCISLLLYISYIIPNIIIDRINHNLQDKEGQQQGLS